MDKYAIIIPVLNPAESLVEYVQSLLGAGAAHIIVVNDGSKDELTYIFTQLKTLESCTVLTHNKNKGKGRALKTAFAYFLTHFQDLQGVVTADADGQHSLEDVCKVAKALENKNGELILGVRDFTGTNVPYRSLIGNKFTSLVYKLLYGYKLKDTQTGLRGISKLHLPWVMNLKGERYEYEINMLIHAKNRHLSFYEIPIQTIYFDHNAGSHFNSFLDSMKIFIKLISGFLHYSYAIILSGIIDIGSFILLSSFLLKGLQLEPRVFYATFVSRMLSSSFNFYMNRKYVFKAGNHFILSMVKYYILCLCLIYASYLLITSANLAIGIPVIMAKIFTDIILGIASYEIQLHWVFKNNQKNVAKQSSLGDHHEG
ncbi:glycosyltransferase [Metabacillus sp. Hm71]|uniref:glycosyltransferase n=1 Tax=Metabacillus sp. Hm71 TaxID=3450743 RepID=UPI003F437ED6